MDTTTMRRRVATARVGELATTTAAGRPHVVPVCFAMIDDDIVTIVDRKPKTTTALRRLDNVHANPFASLLIHHYVEEWDDLWWVRIDGDARVVDDAVSVRELVPTFLEKYPQYRSRAPVGPAILLHPQRWIGWAASDSRP